jgi:hypothetical protein
MSESTGGKNAADRSVLLQNVGDAVVNWRKAQSALDKMPESSVVEGEDAAKKRAELEAIREHAESQLRHWIIESDAAEGSDEAEILRHPGFPLSNSTSSATKPADACRVNRTDTLCR